MPGLDIGAILSAVGGMLLEALMNALTNTLTQLMTQAISDAIHGLSDTLERVLGTDSFLAHALDTFSNNLVAELNSTVSSLLNETNRIAQTALGIVDAQQRLHEQLANIVEGTVGELAHALNVEQEMQYRTGAAITSYLLEFVNRHGDSYEELGRKLFEIQQELVSGDVLTAEEAYNKGLNFVMEYLMYDLRAVERMTQEDLQAAAEFIANQLTEHFDWVRTWFQNTIVAPVTYANAFRSAFTDGIQMTPDEYADMLVAHQEAVDKATQKYMEKLEKELEKQGEI